MLRPLHLVRKRVRRWSVVPLATDSPLFVWDSLSGRRFLVDTGAEISVGSGHTHRTVRTLTQGSKCQVTLHVNWDFIFADVARPLLTADFLRANSLLVDLKAKRLVTYTCPVN